MLTPAHGTDNRYTNGPDEHGHDGSGCRCTPCREAHTLAAQQRRTRDAQARWGAAAPATVDAGPVRDHVRALMAAGLGRRRITTLAGVAPTTLTHLLYGNTGSEPAKRISPDLAAKLLAVTAARGPADGQRVDAVGTRRRLQALTAVGWNGADLARRLGKNPATLHRLLTGAAVTAKTARAVTSLYDQIWDQHPPAETAADRAEAARTRATAADRGWLPPMAWDDHHLDNPNAKPRPNRVRTEAAA